MSGAGAEEKTLADEPTINQSIDQPDDASLATSVSSSQNANQNASQTSRISSTPRHVVEVLSPLKAIEDFSENSRKIARKISLRRAGLADGKAPSLHHTRQAKMSMQKDVQDDLDRGFVWSIKYFIVFPPIARWQRADHLARVFFPLAYGIVVYVYMAMVDFGRTSLGNEKGLPACA